MLSRPETKLQFYGTAALNPLISNVSSPRAVMDANHVSQKLTLITPDETILKSGIEYELGKYIDDARTEHNCTVKAIIPKYPNGALNSETFILVEYDEGGYPCLDMLHINEFMSSHTLFGYKLEPTEEFMNLHYNAHIPADTILGKTSSYGVEGSYNCTVNANIAYMSHPAVAEDGYAISESLAERMGYYKVTTRTINLTKELIPLNINGDDCHFRFLPEVGEAVRPDGMLCAYREANNWFSVVDMSDENLSEPDGNFDTPVYVPINSVVTNIRVIRGNWNKPELSSAITAQLDRYADLYLTFCNDIVSRYEALVKEKTAQYGSIHNVRQTPRLRRYIADRKADLMAANSNKIKLTHRKLPIDQYRIEVTVASIVYPEKGDKLTDFSAAKGVITAVLPDYMMPVDENGVRADIISDDTSTVSRMNLSRVYHGYFGAFSRDNKHRFQLEMMNKYGNNYINKMTYDDVASIGKRLAEMYSLMGPRMSSFITSLNEEELEHHVKDCLRREIYLYYPTDNEIDAVDIIESIERSKYAPHFGKVHYVNLEGREEFSKDNVRICNAPILLLDKITATGSSVSSARTNSFNFPVKGSNLDKHKYPHSLTPTTTLSETEVRILTSFAEPDMVAEMIDLAMSPVSHKNLVRQIYNSDVAYDPNLTIDRETIPYGNTKSLGTLKHIFTAFGFDVEHIDEQRKHQG